MFWSQKPLKLKLPVEIEHVTRYIKSIQNLSQNIYKSISTDEESKKALKNNKASFDI